MSVNDDMIDACPDGSVYFDIGANKGTYTVKMANKPSSKVYAFEPAPENLVKLREVVKDKPNVEVHGIAISDQCGVTKLMLHPGNPGGHSIEKKLEGQRWKHKLENSIDVAVMSLDVWCNQNAINKVDGIKIDVEGHEESVLRGAMETLKKYHPLIALETHQTIDTDSIKGILEECGYEVGEIKPDRGYLLVAKKPHQH
jgi:FkbM family methyltransferase